MPSKDTERIILDLFLQRFGRLSEALPDLIESAEQERPDVILHFGSEKIGAEITESTFEEYRRGCVLYDARFPDAWGDITNLIDHGHPRKNDELVADMGRIDGTWQDMAAGLLGRCARIGDRMAEKRGKLNEPSFRLFSQNWLFIYDVPGLHNDVWTLD